MEEIKEIKNKEKKFAAKLSVLSNSTLTLLKLIAGVISGSIGIISEAIHSGSDLLASIITFFSVSEAAKPADNDHQFGHGKYEDFAGFVEGLLIIFASFYIIYEAIKKINHPSLVTMDVGLGLVVMFISVVANFFISKYLFIIAAKTDSPALFADGEHLRTDIFSSLAVFGGLFFVRITGNPIYDPIIAIVVAVIIFSAGYKLCEEARKNLLDASLSENETSQIKEIIGEYVGDEIVSLKYLRTRKAGMRKNIELTLIVNGELQISTAHELCDRIELHIEEHLQNTDVTIHLEPNC